MLCDVLPHLFHRMRHPHYRWTLLQVVHLMMNTRRAWGFSEIKPDVSSDVHIDEAVPVDLTGVHWATILNATLFRVLQKQSCDPAAS